MIEYPITMAALNPPKSTKSRLHWTENGGAEQTQDFTTSKATGKLTVNDGAAVEVWQTVLDNAGNESDPSAKVSIASAVDGTRPDAPEAVEVGPGDEAPAPPVLFGVGKKVK